MLQPPPNPAGAQTCCPAAIRAACNDWRASPDTNGTENDVVQILLTISRTSLLGLKEGISFDGTLTAPVWDFANTPRA
jgi:hypothetical protein